MDAYIFDVDGVITDVRKRRVTNPELIKYLILLLQKQNPIAFISGRTLPWLKERVINRITEYVQGNNLDNKLLDNIYISGEFGGCQMIFENGEAKETINSAIELDPKLVQKATEISEGFLDVVFIDTEKQTEFTVELNQNLTVDDFIKHEGKIADAYRKLVKELRMEESIEVFEDRLGITIKLRIANKMFATGEFLNWLGRKNISLDEFRVFGDSPSDLQIGEELKKRNLQFKFIYVGNPNDLKDKMSFPIIFTVEKFGKETNEGTLRYLEQE